MIRIILITAMLLSGCMSYSNLENKTPVIDFDSTKLPNVYTGCITPKLKRIWSTGIMVLPDEDSTIVTLEINDTPWGRLKISPAKSGSQVEYRQFASLDIGSAFELTREAIESCK